MASAELSAHLRHPRQSLARSGMGNVASRLLRHALSFRFADVGFGLQRCLSYGLRVITAAAPVRGPHFVA
jgi:hypothetical protein